jgi:malate dehydrogenase (oxaloacetate-decarboxylating)
VERGELTTAISAATATAIAEAVAVQAVADGLAPQRSDDELRHAVQARRWSPT